jgi:hypothetical protein
MSGLTTTALTEFTGATSVPITSQIWLQGFQDTDPRPAALIGSLFLVNYFGSTWTIFMTASAISDGATAEYVIYYYSR